MSYVIVRRRARWSDDIEKSEKEWYMDYGDIYGRGRWDVQGNGYFDFPMPFPSYRDAAYRLATLMTEEVGKAPDESSTWEWWYTISEYRR